MSRVCGEYGRIVGVYLRESVRIMRAQAKKVGRRAGRVAFACALSDQRGRTLCTCMVTASVQVQSSFPSPPPP